LRVVWLQRESEAFARYLMPVTSLPWLGVVAEYRTAVLGKIG